MRQYLARLRQEGKNQLIVGAGANLIYIYMEVVEMKKM